MSHHIAVVSDLHANGRALAATLARAREVGHDRLVILGDLLTYGDDVEQVLDLVEAEVERGAVLVIGNHDQLYLDLADGSRAYYESLPAWIRESVDHTASRLDTARFRALPWVDEWIFDRILFAHANPFGPRDWTYLNDDAQHERAAKVLGDRGLRAGVFGHTHRARLFGDTPLVANSGSVGQPRGKPIVSTFLHVTLDDRDLATAVEPVDYDVAAHVAALDGTPLSQVTKQRLRGFFG